MGALEKEDAALIDGESKSGSLLTLEEGADAAFSPVDVDDFARFHFEEEETNFPSHHTSTFEHHNMDDEIYDENCSPDSPHDLSWKEYLAKTARNMIVVCGGACVPESTAAIAPAIKSLLGNLAKKKNLLIMDAGDGGSDLQEYYATLRSFLPAESGSGIKFADTNGFVPSYRPQVEVQAQDRFVELPNGMTLCILDDCKHFWVTHEDSKVELIPPPALKADIYVHRNSQIKNVVCTERHTGAWLLRCPDLTQPNLWITTETDSDAVGGVLLFDADEEAVTAYSYVWYAGEPRPRLTQHLLTHTQAAQ